MKLGFFKMKLFRHSAMLLLMGLLLGGCEVGQKVGPEAPELPRIDTVVECEGVYPHHLQGVCVDGEAIYWSFTTRMVKTDLQGKRLGELAVVNHHGDLCVVDGVLYVAVNLGKFNDAKGNADSWVYAYEADDLSFVAKYETQEVFHGAGGMGYMDGRFYVVGGLPEGVEANYVYEYDRDFKFIKKHVIASGHTHLGIQTATFAHGRWWFGCYGRPPVLLVTDGDFNMSGRYEFNCSYGIVGVRNGMLLAADGGYVEKEGHTGRLRTVVGDEGKGLVEVK